MRKVSLAYLQTGVNIPSLALNVATTIGGGKTRKDISVFEGVTGLELQGTNPDTKLQETWVIPWPNVKIYCPVLNETVSSKAK